MPIKRILIVINSLSQGGAERVASTLLAHYVEDSSFEVELVLLEDEIEYPLPKEVKVSVLSSLNNQDSSIKKTLYIPTLAFKLHQHIQKTQPDLVVSFLYRSDFVNLLASLFHKIPTIASERVNASSTYATPSLSATINKFLIKRLYPKASHIINVSEGTKWDLVDHFGIQEARQSVIYNPYDIPKIQDLAKESIPLQIERERTLVLVSRFRPIKNIQMVLKALAIMKEEATLILVGDGSEMDVLKALAKELGIENRTLFVGGQDNPYKYMSKAAIYLSASNSEGFPNALVEAMICGCAIVSTDCPSGPREILAPESDILSLMKEGIEYAPYGTLVAVDDTVALSESLDTLLSDYTKIEAYQKASMKRAMQFRLDAICQQYSTTFKRVIEEGRK